MKYMLLIYGNEAGMLAASKETADQMLAAYGAYTEAMKKAGVHVGSNRLRPTTLGTTVRVANGKTEVLDGPYAETKEQLGGYYMIEVPDSTRRYPGRRVARPRAMGRSRCGRSGSCSPSRIGPSANDAAGKRPARPRGRRSSGAPELRQAGRFSGGAHARRRGCRGRLGGGLRGRLGGLAREPNPHKPGGMADGGGAAQDDRCGAAAPQP